MMDRDERIAAALPLIERIAAKLGHRPGSRLHDDVVSAGHEAIVKAADLFDPTKAPQGEEGFMPWVCQRIRWAMMNVVSSTRNDQSLDAELGDDEGLTLAKSTADRRADDPAELAQVNEWKEKHVKKRSVLRLADCRTMTPAPDGVGAWAQKLKEAAFNAVSEGDVTELMSGLMARAKGGDLQAAKLVLGYLTGGNQRPQITVVQGVQINAGNEEAETA